MFFKLYKMLAFIAIIYSINNLLLSFFFTFGKDDLKMYTILLTIAVIITMFFNEEEREGFETDETLIKQEEGLKEDIQGNLQVLLNDMINKTSESEDTDPITNTDTSTVRSELSNEQESKITTENIANSQLVVEDTGVPKSMVYVDDEEPRTDKNTIMPVSDWLNPQYNKIATQTGCMCPMVPTYGSNFSEIV